MKKNTAMFELLSNLLFSLETFTSFHTYRCLPGTALGARALGWHLTNMRDRGGITTRVWNRKSRCACDCQFGWVRDRQISKWYSCPSSYTIIFFFLICHQSGLLRTAPDNLQQILARGPSAACSAHTFRFREKLCLGCILGGQSASASVCKPLCSLSAYRSGPEH